MALCGDDHPKLIARINRIEGQVRGLKKMVRHLIKAYQADRKIRLFGREKAHPKGWKVRVTEIDEGIIFRDNQVTVEAFRVVHGNWTEAYGFKFTTPDRTVVISGDTVPCAKLIEKSRGVDILIHEVYSQEKLAERPKLERGAWHPYWRLCPVERKSLPGVDLAVAGGWRDTLALKLSYQQADPATVPRAVEGLVHTKEIVAHRRRTDSRMHETPQSHLTVVAGTFFSQ